MKQKYHTITDIVATVYCEQKAVFDRARGDACPAEVRRKAITGTVEHWRFQVEGRSQMLIDRRCFIASQVYGASAWQTDTLRAWRDGALRPSRAGRLGIAVYYALSPTAARLLARSPRLARLVRAALDVLVQRLESWRCTR